MRNNRGKGGGANFRVVLFSLLLSVVEIIHRVRSSTVVSRSHEYKAQDPFEGLASPQHTAEYQLRDTKWSEMDGISPNCGVCQTGSNNLDSRVGYTIEN